MTIEGISPLLMHAYPLQPIEGLDKKSSKEQAEHAAYRCPDTGELFIPGVSVQRALVAGAAYSKGKGRASLAKPVAACVIIGSERLTLGTKEYVVDSRAVVIPSTKGRIVRHRPRLDKWRASFDVDFDDTLLTADQLRRVVDDTGKNVGILDFRPEHKGPFGRFMVVSWKD